MKKLKLYTKTFFLYSGASAVYCIHGPCAAVFSYPAGTAGTVGGYKPCRNNAHRFHKPDAVYKADDFKGSADLTRLLYPGFHSVFPSVFETDHGSCQTYFGSHRTDGEDGQNCGLRNPCAG